MKKIKAITVSLIMLVGILTLALSGQEAEAKQIENAITANTTKGDLYGNAEGTRYCCKQSHDRDCGAAYCK